MRGPSPADFVRELPSGGTLIAAGISGSGKTHHLKLGLAGSDHVAVIDPYARVDAERHRKGKRERERWEGTHVTYSQLRDDPSPLLESPCFVVIDPETLEAAKLGERVNRILEWCWSVGDLDIVLEESGLYSREAAALVLRCATGGAHRGLRFYLLAQGYGQVTITATRYVNRLMLFAQGEEADLSELRRKVGASYEQQLRRMNPKRRELPLLWEQGQLEGATQ